MDDRQPRNLATLCVLPFQFYFPLFIEPCLIGVLLKRVPGSSPRLLYVAGVTCFSYLRQYPHDCTHIPMIAIDFLKSLL